MSKQKEILKEFIRVFAGSNYLNIPDKIPYGGEREQIGSLKNKSEEIADHLKDLPEEEDDEDQYGPVPPTGDRITVHNDYFTRDYSPRPSKPIYR